MLCVLNLPCVNIIRCSRAFGRMLTSADQIGKMCHVMSIDEKVTCVGWFNVLMTEFIVVSGRKDGVYLVLIYRHVVIFAARFG